jgi:hypothetical protein
MGEKYKSFLQALDEPLAYDVKGTKNIMTQITKEKKRLFMTLHTGNWFTYFCFYFYFYGLGLPGVR